ncbi:glutathione S-transferase [Roseitranquillus sediminis]|uniref:glutathione S-transferase n=1 Tax=Roseitranquillus sediminis TaxID=2809051 RepID=UPI001D0C00FD|nr:glutathione S-transferase [Roseitranquillus sediminis]MBM9593513.1 glutathione S-transferase [Roseitranquillus sediminis]
MQLLHSPASPFVRKARVTAIEAGIADRIELVDVHTSAVATHQAVAAANPVGKIPALIREDGPTLYDSRVICRYLDWLAGSRLYPESRIWEVLTLESLADGMMDAAVLITYERRFRDEGKRHEGWMQGQRDRISRSLDALADRWMSHLGGPLTVGQIAVACALAYLDFRHEDLDWRAGHGALSDWYEKFASRESMIATRPPSGA